MARSNFYRAVFGEKPPPNWYPEGKKGHRSGKQKLARKECRSGLSS